MKDIQERRQETPKMLLGRLPGRCGVPPRVSSRAPRIVTESGLQKLRLWVQKLGKFSSKFLKSMRLRRVEGQKHRDSRRDRTKGAAKFPQIFPYRFPDESR